jgi:uncharacterized Zn finger protein
MNPSKIQLTPSVLQNSQEVKCDNCENNTFINAYQLRLISKVLVGASEDQLLPVPVFSCSKCGHVNDDFIPDYAKSKNKLQNPFA